MIQAERRALRPDAQAFDEVRIVTVPRYKTSGLSGNEWRISARIEFYRKGTKVHEDYMMDVQHACYALGFKHMEACDNAIGYFGGIDDLCDQEGCSNKGTNKLYLKHEYCKSGHREDLHMPTFRLFCDQHKTRGDSDFEDCDENYQKKHNG